MIFPKLTQLLSASLDKVNPSGQTSNPVAPYELLKSLDSHSIPAMPMKTGKATDNALDKT